jgi:hypothetical protein
MGLSLVKECACASATEREEELMYVIKQHARAHKTTTQWNKRQTRRTAGMAASILVAWSEQTWALTISIPKPMRGLAACRRCAKVVRN